jgi:hypothetical protein
MTAFALSREWRRLRFRGYDALCAALPQCVLGGLGFFRAGETLARRAVIGRLAQSEILRFAQNDSKEAFSRSL